MVFDALWPGGFFAFWENNPLNPGTRAVMARIPFDRNANPIFPGPAKKMLRQAGFRMEVITSWFFFPRALAAFRPLEPYLSWTLLVGAIPYSRAKTVTSNGLVTILLNRGNQQLDFPGTQFLTTLWQRKRMRRRTPIGKWRAASDRRRAKSSQN
jgi:hypothetical protein